MENNTSVKKIKSVTVNSFEGPKTITMVPIVIDNTKEVSDVICTQCCPYGSVCSKLRHPEHLDNPNLTLNDWCVDLSFSDDKQTELSDLGQYYPKAGEIENLYPKENDFIQELIKTNSLVNINEFIDNVCSGFCDQYDSCHSNCSSKNQLCILKELFKKTQDPVILNKDNKSLSDPE